MQSMVTIISMVTLVYLVLLPPLSSIGNMARMSTAKRSKAPRMTLSILNQKGGVGKSTLATNLGAAAHLDGLRTIILDLDSQGSALDWYAARQEGSRLEGLTVAGSDRALTAARFRELTSGYDMAILDGPPRLGDITRAAAVASDVVLMPLRPGAFDWWACSETLALIDSADSVRSELGRPPVRRMFILNAADERTRLARAALDALAKVGEIVPVSIASRVVYPEASTAGEAVLTFAPDSSATDEIGRLWRALAACMSERNRTDG